MTGMTASERIVLSEEGSDLFEATCLDCNSTKSYFTAQGVGYFKLNHEGHKIRVREPSREGKEEDEAARAPVAMDAEVGVEQPAVSQRGASASERIPMGNGAVRLMNLVVDVVDEESGRAVKVFGIAGGVERFTKEFTFKQADDLNVFLESGVFADPATGMTYTWSPDRIDISMDVVKMIEAPREEPVAPAVLEAEPMPVSVQEVEVEVPKAPVVPTHTAAAELPKAQAPAEEVLLGKLSYVQPGAEYRDASVRISKVLRKYRWNTEPPYVIGAMFDDLMSIQSQTGMIRASAIQAVAELGYEFIAIEAPSGVMTAWFKKKDGGERIPDDGPLEFTPPTVG